MKEAFQGAELAGTRFGTVISIAGIVQIIKDVFLGDSLDVIGGDAGQADFLGWCGIVHTLPALLHHIAEEPAQIQIIAVDCARGTQLYKIQIMQIFNYVIRNVQIRCVTLRMGHINITAHNQPSTYQSYCRSAHKQRFCFFIVPQQASTRQFHKIIRNTNGLKQYKA